MGMNPVAWRGTSGSVSTIKELDAAELRELAYVVLSSLATDSDYTGVVKIGTPAGFTTIGTWDDTIRATDGSISTSTNTLSQDLTSSYTSITAPPDFFYANSTSSFPLRLANTAQLNSLADSILYYCTTEEGPNSYRLDSSTPAGTYGGTWQSVGTISDYKTTLTTQSAVNLWIRVDDGGYTGSFFRPLKRGSADGTINQFTDTEIYRLTRIVRQRIADTGVGQYSFGETAPGTGTWTSVGSIVDTVATATGTFTQGYLGPESYATDYLGPETYTTAYTSDITYTAEYLGTVFVPTSFNTFSNYTAAYVEVTNYTADVAYQAEGDLFFKYYYGPGPFGPGVPFTGAATNYAGQPSKTIYYQGPGPVYSFIIAPYLGPASYVGNNSVPFTNPSFPYLGPAPPQAYTGGPYPGYVGPKGTFTKPNANFTGPGPANSTNFFGPETYLGTDTYTNEDKTSFAAPGTNYAGPKGTFTGAPTVSFFDPNYPYARAYVSAGEVQYAGELIYFGQAEWYGPDYFGPLTDFFGTYQIVINYTTDYNVITGKVVPIAYPDSGGPFISNFTAVDSGPDFSTGYTNEDATGFTGLFTNPDAITYTAEYQGDLSNYNQGPVSFATVDIKNTVSLVTKYLWRRVA